MWQGCALARHERLAAGRRGAGPFLAEFEAYFAGRLQRFTLPLAARGTAFQQAVWQALCDIPYGETRSYGDIARAIGKPSAVRAVGAANGRNPLSIIIPCHRVIGQRSSLTGYAEACPSSRRCCASRGSRADPQHHSLPARAVRSLAPNPSGLHCRGASSGTLKTRD